MCEEWPRGFYIDKEKGAIYNDLRSNDIFVRGRKTLLTQNVSLFIGLLHTTRPLD